MSIQNAYNQWSEIYDSNENLTRDLDQLLTRSTFASQHFHSILELGCGTGKNTTFLVQIGDKIHALDFSEGMIAKAKEKIQAGNVRFSTADLTQKWPCENEAYDLISCNLVLEHIRELPHIFSEAARVLQTNGKFFINELHPFKQYRGTKARFEKGDETIEVDAFTHHVSDFTKAASDHGLTLLHLDEHWHAQDQNKPPRILSLLFEKK
jgi:ubiquinone/menaquinone biosynthesis C-methylase UbiE